MRIFSTIFFLVIAVNLLSSQPVTLRGTVKDAASGDPLTGAHVSVHNYSGHTLLMQSLTGRGGGFLLSGLPEGKVILSVTFVGYRVFESELTLSAGIEVMKEIQLISSPVPVGEVTVSALRRDRLLRNVSLPMAIMTESAIEKMPAISMADAISHEPGVSLARDAAWATSVNIRGLSENRIVTLIDGNRVETSTDIAAGLAMIDVNDIQRIEVIKGAASSLYGTGALGGVVNIITREGRYDEKFYAEGSLTGAYNTVNQMHSEYASVNIGDSKWYARVSGTYRNAENTMTPKGELLNSQFTDNNISAKVGVKPVTNHELILNYQRFFAKDVGIPGGKAFPLTATATYPTELREMFSAAYEIKKPGEYLDELKVKYFHQYIVRDVLLRPNANVAITPSGYHTTNGIQLQSGWILAPDNYLIAGLDIWQRDLLTERERNVRQPVTDSAGNVTRFNEIVVGEIPIPKSSYRSAGVFIQDELTALDDRLKLTLGGRIDLIRVKNESVVDPYYRIFNGVRNDNPPGQRLTFAEGDVSDVSWSTDLGLMYSLTKKSDLTFTASRAFRSPSLDERFKYIDLGATVRLGDPDLKPEKGYFFDLGGRIWLDRFQLSANAFLNLLTDMIVEMPGEAQFPLTNNPDSLVTLNALINSNVDNAMLFGFDMSANYSIYNGFVLFATASYIRGMDTRNDKNLPFIPPFNVRTGLRYQLPKWFGTELSVDMATDQTLTGEGETQTSGYSKYDFSLYSMPMDLNFLKLTVFTGIENITDRAYINHLASNRGFIKYEPGRNVFIRIRVSF